MATWTIDCTGELTDTETHGTTNIGKRVVDRFSIDWVIPPHSLHPDWPVRIAWADVECIDGPTDYDPSDPLRYYLHVQDVSHDDRLVAFSGGYYAFARDIRLKATMFAEMYSSDAGRWYDLQPQNRFQAELTLTLKPKPEIANPPWSVPQGIILPSSPHEVAIDATPDKTCTYWVRRHIYAEPIKKASASIECLNENAACNHPHATADLRPWIGTEVLPDGSGVVLHPKNTRENERYRIMLDVGYMQTIYYRTVAVDGGKLQGEWSPSRLSASLPV